MTQRAQAVQLRVVWGKCGSGNWCQLNAVNLQDTAFDGAEGIYVIWHAGANPRTVYVGQGAIRDRLNAHRHDPRIQAYAKLGLYVTWASVPASQRGGVEAYLAAKYDPLVGERRPDDDPVSVNTPGE